MDMTATRTITNDDDREVNLRIPTEDDSNVWSYCSDSTMDPEEDITIFENDMILGQARSASAATTTDEIVSTIGFCRDILLAAVGGMGIAISVATHIGLSHWDDLTDKIDKEKMAGIATALIAVCFVIVLILIVWFTRHIQSLLSLPTVTKKKPTATNKASQPVIMSYLAQIIKKMLPGSGRKQQDTTSMIVRKSGATIPACLTESGRSEPLPAAPYSSAVDNLLDYLRASQRESQILNGGGHFGRPRSLSINCGVSSSYNEKPVAEFFPETTIMFADIQGFTAWSSTREPSQVFVLLETLYHSFDTIAYRRKVYKVETVGDCYVACTGLPDPRKDHAILMARFARDCLKRMRPLCKRLVIQLGPDTCDLSIRIGIHSGPVTGGILRGERSRFQLFGAAMNTASRIESTGQGGQIHVSKATAQLLQQGGKGHWLSLRPAKVMAKGLGALQTYWLKIQSNGSDAHSSISGFSSGDESDHLDRDDSYHSTAKDIHRVNSGLSLGNGALPSSSNSGGQTAELGFTISHSKIERLISWNVDLLHRLLQQIVARRQCLVDADPNRKADADESIYMHQRDGTTTLFEEVRESIEMPSFNYSRTAAEEAQNIKLDPEVHGQLQDYVRNVAKMYPNNPFHNFEHASHVTMSVAKLLSRIVAPSARDVGKSMEGSGRCPLHDHTFGITSDPLTQFSCVLSALIHDADHPGVPNTQLVREGTIEAEIYKGKSVAEQNSVDRCWALLMSPKYEALRKTIYTTKSGLHRFRSLVVNSVLATDICDPDLKNLRNARWEKAFNYRHQQNNSNSNISLSSVFSVTSEEPEESFKAASDRKATIVIEHLIQASDVAHTMQHWQVYRKWNERLFQECYKAYREGRATKDPSDCWYEGEKGFYDYYIIPLAKKLKECGVFGVSSSEYLDYALQNREEWELCGRQVVEEMKAKVTAGVDSQDP